MSKSVHQLDARRLLCPLPVIRVQQMIDDLGQDGVGSSIVTTCTDPGAMYDIPAWAKIHGHKLLDKQEDDYEYIITIEIGQT